MNVVFRVDASLQIGSGHVMRCLTLADELKKNDANILFICRKLNGYMAESIHKRGYPCKLLSDQEGSFRSYENDPDHASFLSVPWQKDADDVINSFGAIEIDCLIVDHYGLDYRWQKKLRPQCNYIMVIDDLADRRLDCDILLDQTYDRNKNAYQSLIPRHCRVLIGSQYALLRPEFAKFRPIALKKRKKYKDIRNILVFMGGGDKTNLTGSIIDILSKVRWKKRPEINVVISGQTPYVSSLTDQIANHPLTVTLLTDVTNMAELMLDADLSIGAAGTTSWERCALALPSLIKVLEKNQELIASTLEGIGAVRVWQRVADLQRCIEEIDKNSWLKMHAASARVCDGQGCRRVIRELDHALC